MTREDDIRALVTELKTRQAKFGVKEKKSRLQVYSDQTARKGLFYSIKNAWITVSIRPVSPKASFDAVVRYHFWSETGPVAREARFHVRGGKGVHSQALKVREEDAGWLEKILGGKRGGLLKILTVEVTSRGFATAYDINIG